MPITFPSSPSNGQTYTVGARTWTWSGSVWELNANTIATASVGTGQIADNAITTAKIAAGAVVEADIATDAVTTNKVANNAITASKLASNAVTTEKLGTDVQLGYRNRIINGGFDVWQRSTSATTTGTDAYASADRWRSRTAAGAGSMTVSRQSPSLTGFRYCARVQRVNGNTNTDPLQFIQTLETSNSIPLAGNPVTVSFYARKGANYSPTSSALKVFLVSGTGTDQYWISFTSAATVISQTATLTNSWQRFSYTATPGSTATQFYVMFEMNPTGTASTNDWYEVTGVQLEAGSVATPFEFEDIQTTLNKCRRYFEIYRGAEYGYFKQHPAQVDVANRAETHMFYEEKRANPTITVSNAGHFSAEGIGVNYGGVAYTFNTYVGTGIHETLLFFDVPGTLNTYSVAHIIMNGSGTISISSEL